MWTWRINNNNSYQNASCKICYESRPVGEEDMYSSAAGAPGGTKYA